MEKNIHLGKYSLTSMEIMIVKENVAKIAFS